MQRLARIIPNGHHKPPVPVEVRDGIADLKDYTTDPELGTTTTVAGEAISGLSRLYHLRETDKVKQAYSALSRLRVRNTDTFGDDMPINHVTVYKRFRDVVDGLMYAIERDFHKELKQQLKGYGR